MTITKDQAQMLSSLAIACRPNRAPTWDEAGVMASIAEIRNMSLPEVILRVIRAAADRDAITPGVIPKNGPHANEVLKPPKWEPTVLDPAERCGICAHENHAGKCPRCAPIDDHVGEADFKQKRDGGTVRQIVESIKAEVAPTAPPPEPESLDDLTRNPHVEEVRQVVAAVKAEQIATDVVREHTESQLEASA